MEKSVTINRSTLGTFLFFVPIASLIWTSIAIIFFFRRFDFLQITDCGWYWKVVTNLRAFDPAIQPLYPAIVRGLSELFPNIEQSFIGQVISFISYVIAVPFMYKIFDLLNVKRALIMTLLWAMFPLVGVTMAVFPRANAILLLFTVLCIWGYLKNNRITFLVTASLLPLIHKSSPFFLVFLLPIAFFEKKIKWWMVILTVIPTFIYILLGALHHGSLLWYIQPNKNVTHATSLVLGDGLIGSLILGFRGNFAVMIKAILVNSYFVLACYMIWSKMWKKNLFLISLILPAIALGFILPSYEILSIIDYTTFMIIPFSMLNCHDELHFGKNKFTYIYWLGVVGAYFSQVAFVFYSFRYYGLSLF